MYGHIKQLALAEKRGIEAAGGTADLYQYVFFPVTIPRCQPFSNEVFGSMMLPIPYTITNPQTPTESAKPSLKKSSPKCTPRQKTPKSPSSPPTSSKPTTPSSSVSPPATATCRRNGKLSGMPLVNNGVKVPTGGNTLVCSCLREQWAEDRKARSLAV